MQHHKKRKATSRRWALKARRQARLQQAEAVTVNHSSGSAPCPAAPVTLEDVTVKERRSWLPSLGVSVLLKVVGRVCRGWRFSVAQVCTGFLNLLLSWRDQAWQLEMLRQQVEELQREMSVMRSSVQDISRANPTCCCHTVGWSRPHTDGCGSSVDPILAGPLLPPPPPPPPLPITVPQKPVIIVTKKVTSAVTQKEKGRSATVTLRDIQSVKLRKVANDTIKVSPGKSRPPLITVADLERVHLRRSHSDFTLKPYQSLGRSTNKSPLNLRKQLKKVHIDRSPGGTPLFDKENRECGTGLTPVMTQALRRKFQIAIPRSPSPKFNKKYEEEN